MPDDHAPRYQLIRDLERHKTARIAAERNDHTDPASPPERRDGEQAWANLERMLETGEENPMS